MNQRTRTTKHQQGAALITVVIMFAILVPLLFALTRLVIGEIKRLQVFESSAVASVAVDSGFEHALYKVRKQALFPCKSHAQCDIGTEGADDSGQQNVTKGTSERLENMTYEVRITDCAGFQRNDDDDSTSGRSESDKKRDHELCCKITVEGRVESSIQNRCLRSIGHHNQSNRARQITY